MSDQQLMSWREFKEKCVRLWQKRQELEDKFEHADEIARSNGVLVVVALPTRLDTSFLETDAETYEKLSNKAKRRLKQERREHKARAAALRVEPEIILRRRSAAPRGAAD